MPGSPRRTWWSASWPRKGSQRTDLGREKFVERVWQWKEVYLERIDNQHRRLGVSCDWERERFTLDEGLSRAVRDGLRAPL